MDVNKQQRKFTLADYELVLLRTSQQEWSFDESAELASLVATALENAGNMDTSLYPAGAERNKMISFKSTAESIGRMMLTQLDPYLPELSDTDLDRFFE